MRGRGVRILGKVENDEPNDDLGNPNIRHGRGIFYHGQGIKDEFCFGVGMLLVCRIGGVDRARATAWKRGIRAMLSHLDILPPKGHGCEIPASARLFAAGVVHQRAAVTRRCDGLGPHTSPAAPSRQNSWVLDQLLCWLANLVCMISSPTIDKMAPTVFDHDMFHDTFVYWSGLGRVKDTKKDF
jgi:hypothetical protein